MGKVKLAQTAGGLRDIRDGQRSADVRVDIVQRSPDLASGQAALSGVGSRMAASDDGRDDFVEQIDRAECRSTVTPKNLISQSQRGL